MGVSNVNNANKIDLTKLGLLSKTKSAQSNKPAYMKMTGSIFNAPEVKQQAQTTNLATLNTNKSIEELNSNPQNTEEKKAEKEEESVDQGSVQSLGKQAKKGTQETENNTRTVNKFTSEGKKLNKTIKNEDKKFQAQLKQQQAAILKDNTKLEKLIQESDEAQLQVDDAQNELEGLLGSSSFTMSRGNGSQGSQSTNPNQDRIQQLQQIIGSKTTLVQSNGKQIYSLRRSSSRTLSKMKRTNANFVKVHKQNTKAIKQNQNETSGVLKVANKIEQYSALAEQGGKTLDLVGQGLVTAGEAMASSSIPAVAAVGAAMITAGTVMSKIGTVVEMVGQYGQLAANVTKTAAYAAEGNLMGAMSSAAAAVQSGAAAAKSTKDLKSTFGEIDQRAQEATNKATANLAAKQTVKQTQQEAVDKLGANATKEQIKQAKSEALGGMTKKEMKKSISSNLQTQMSEGKINSKDLLNDVKNKTISSNSAVTTAKTDAIKEFKENVTAANGKVTNGVVSGLDQKARNKVGQKTVSSFQNAAKKAQKSTQKFDFQKFSQGIMTTAALFNAQNTGSTQGTSRGYAPQWDLNADPKMSRIRKSRMAAMRHAAFV